MESLHMALAWSLPPLFSSSLSFPFSLSLPSLFIYSPLSFSFLSLFLSPSIFLFHAYTHKHTHPVKKHHAFSSHKWNETHHTINTHTHTQWVYTTGKCITSSFCEVINIRSVGRVRAGVLYVGKHLGWFMLDRQSITGDSSQKVCTINHINHICLS